MKPPAGYREALPYLIVTEKEKSRARPIIAYPALLKTYPSIIFYQHSIYQQLLFFFLNNHKLVG